MNDFLRMLTPVGVLIALGTGASASAQEGRLELELEAGPAWQSRNEVEVPNDGSATRFSLADIAGSGPFWAGRVYLTWRFSEGHSLRLLYAPFSLTATGRSERPLSFAGETYAGGAPVEATYTFNSYRASYRWRLHSGERLTAWLGITAKVRDATIALAQGTTSSRKDDLGFVPLLHLAGAWRPAPSWQLSLDVDGLAGGPGRAVDASLALRYDLGDRWSLGSGYRTVEGGADVEEVYAFAWLHYGVVSLTWRP